MSTAQVRKHGSSFGKRDALELDQIFLRLREISDNLAYSEVGSERGRDERLLAALALLDGAVRSFVGLTRFWRYFAVDSEAAGRLRQAFAADGDPVQEGALRRIGEEIAVAPMTAEESVARLRESILLLNRPLRLRARKRQGDLTAHDIRIAFAGMSVTATETYETFLESHLLGASSDADRETKKAAARRLLSALTVGATVMGTLSDSPETDIAGPVSVVWAEVAPEQSAQSAPEQPAPEQLAPEQLGRDKPTFGEAVLPAGETPALSPPRESKSGGRDDATTPAFGLRIPDVARQD